MFNFFLSYQWLSYTRPSGPPSPVPDGLERHWLDTPGGKIEVLSATPSSSISPSTPPVVFCHGGMGSAWVWTEYMRCLSARGIACYAVSLRGHGNSWHPTYLGMLFSTTRGMLADDLVSCVDWVQARDDNNNDNNNNNKSRVILVGHSSGGGLSQAILSEGRVKVEKLALLGAVPAFGSMGVYMNWAKLDPWFMIRMPFHLWHSNSPLSHPRLVQRAFFGDKFPLASVVEFQRHMSRYESYLWPFSMMAPFASARSVLEPVASDGPVNVLVMGGSQDAIVTPAVVEETAAFYRKEGEKMGRTVRMEMVEGAGHHLQNDVQWEDGAAKLLAFIQA